MLDLVFLSLGLILVLLWEYGAAMLTLRLGWTSLVGVHRRTRWRWAASLANDCWAAERVLTGWRWRENR